MCIGPSIAAFLKTLDSSSKFSQLKSFYYFGRCSSELTERVPICHSCGSFTSYSNRLHNFSVTFPPKSYKDFYVNSFFPCAATLWNSLPAECFHLTYDINPANICWSSRHVLKTSSKRLQRNNFSSSKTSCRRLKDVLQSRLDNVLEHEKLFR